MHIPRALKLETHNVDADEGDEHFLSSQILYRDRDTDDSDDKLADTHAGSTDEEKTTATEALNTPHSGQGHEDIDNVGGDGDQERVANARVLEECRAVVEDEVDYKKNELEITAFSVD